jgi:hypothetical protein
VVNTTTRRPRGSGWVANVAAHSYASSTDGARSAPHCRQIPSNTRSSLASDPVWLAAARLPSAATPPFTSTSGLRAVNARSESMKCAPSATPSR